MDAEHNQDYKLYDLLWLTFDLTSTNVEKLRDLSNNQRVEYYIAQLPERTELKSYDLQLASMLLGAYGVEIRNTTTLKSEYVILGPRLILQ